MARYASSTGAPHFADWCARHAIQSIDQFADRPLELEAWQLDLLWEALAADESGNPYWSSVILVVSRKNGKSVLLAAYSLYSLLVDIGQPEILLAASSDKQAGRLFDYCASFVRRSVFIRDRVVLRDYAGEIARADGGGKLVRMSSDPRRAHGYSPSRMVVDELHSWTTPSLRRAWAAFTSAGGARRNTQTLVISTAGEAHERDESVLGRLIDQNEAQGEVERRGALTISRNHDARVLIFNYSAPVRSRDVQEARRDFAAIRAANPASWVTDDYLRRQQANPELDAAEFLQLHGCVWASGSETFVDLDAWDEMADGGLIADGRGASLGMDGSRNYDTTVVAWASAAPDGRIDVDCRVWSVRPEAPHHVLCDGTSIDLGEVEDFVVEECFGRLDVGGCIFDPRFLGRSVELIEDRLGGAQIAAVEPQSKLYRDALSAFHRACTDGRIRHRGDPVLRAHLAATKASQDERGWVVRKRQTPRPIDAVIAIALAVWWEELHPSGVEPSYVFRAGR